MIIVMIIIMIICNQSYFYKPLDMCTGQVSIMQGLTSGSLSQTPCLTVITYHMSGSRLPLWKEMTTLVFDIKTKCGHIIGVWDQTP